MSEIKVNSIKGVGASSAAITVNNTDGTCTVNNTQRQGRNLLTNGACVIAQRGTDATGSAANGYATVDRFRADQSGTDAYIEQHQVDVASGTTPYAAGFRKAFQIKNGNQSSGAGTSDRVVIMYRIEAQDIANSGWDYTSSSSYLTFSFYVKSSVAQNFYADFRSYDGTGQGYAIETGSLSANTWTKVTKTIPGNSNLQFDNDNNVGLEIQWTLYRGTDTTGTKSLNTWAAYNSSDRVPDMASTWYTTDDATFEITGIQLEVGSVATDFQFEDKNTTLRKCQRYFWRFGLVDSAWIFSGIIAGSSQQARCLAKFPVPMRANPTITYNDLVCDSEVSGSVETVNSVINTYFNSDFGGRVALGLAASSSASTGSPLNIYADSSSGYIQGDSEL